MLLLLLLVAVTSKQYRQYDITDQSFDRFISRYGNNKLEYSSPIYPLLNVLHAIKNWSTVSDLNLPAPSEYPYFRWMPFWGNGSIPVNDTKKSNKVNFNPLNCFNDGSFYTQYNPNNSSEIIIHLELLNKSYDHIIIAHKFCLNQNKRKEIQEYVSNIVGDCKLYNSCHVLSLHSMRIRERNDDTKTANDNADTKQHILFSILNSLHSYLVHSDKELFRLKRNDENSKLR
eukprot:12434_1